MFRYSNNLLGVVGPYNLNIVLVQPPFSPLGINCCFFIIFRKGLSAWFVSKISEVGINQSLDVRVGRVPRVERLKIPVLFFDQSVNRLSKEVMVIICKGLKKVEKASHGGKRPRHYLMMSTVIGASTGMNNHPVIGSDASIKLSRNTPAASSAERINSAAPVNPGVPMPTRMVTENSLVEADAAHARASSLSE